MHPERRRSDEAASLSARACTTGRRRPDGTAPASQAGFEKRSARRRNSGAAEDSERYESRVARGRSDDSRRVAGAAESLRREVDRETGATPCGDHQVAGAPTLPVELQPDGSGSIRGRDRRGRDDGEQDGSLPHDSITPARLAPFQRSRSAPGEWHRQAAALAERPRRPFPLRALARDRPFAAAERAGADRLRRLNAVPVLGRTDGHAVQSKVMQLRGQMCARPRP